MDSRADSSVRQHLTELGQPVGRRERIGLRGNVQRFDSAHSERDKPDINFLWCMTLTVTLARGRKVRVHIRNTEFKTVKPLRSQWERFVLLVFRKLP
jgi:hypothetical protein